MKKQFILTVLAIIFAVPFTQAQCESYNPKFASPSKNSPDYGKSYTLYYFSRIQPNTTNKAFLSKIYSLTFINYDNNNRLDNFICEDFNEKFNVKVRTLVSEEAQRWVQTKMASSSGSTYYVCTSLDEVKKFHKEMSAIYKGKYQLTILDDFKPTNFEYKDSDKYEMHILIHKVVGE